MKRLPRFKCRTAGRTSDGRICYYGKKDSGDPDAADLTLWVTLGRPLVDAGNYVRLSRIGLDEAKLYKELSEMDPSEVVASQERRVSELLAATHSSELRRHAGVGDA